MLNVLINQIFGKKIGFYVNIIVYIGITILISLQIATLILVRMLYNNLDKNNCNDCNYKNKFKNYLYDGSIIILALLILNIFQNLIMTFFNLRKKNKLYVYLSIVLTVIILINIIIYNIILAIEMNKLNINCDCIQKILNDFLFIRDKRIPPLN